MSDRERVYWLKASGIPGSTWTKVTKEEWIKAERRAGFRPKLSSDDPRYMTTCATGGFGDGSISGTTTNDETPPTY